MISIVMYGRNDSHGYNLHRRAALSLNCLAEILTDPDDEIVFVDYNTPRTLPTFIEAIADTLTDRCIGKLRVLRVREEIHRRVYGGRTHLNAVEPLARNIALRRSNPANRWVLSTNTDMILMPGGAARSLAALAAGLGDGLYHLPRFELPESFWESLPRSDPAAAFAAIESWSPRLAFDEVTRMDDWMLYDAPGDFQLFPRATLMALDGFDESMCHGWHVDSNLARRLWLHFGETRSMAAALRGYHCNHGRVTSIYQGVDRTENDDARYVFGLRRPDIPAQRGVWGLPDETIEEVSLARARGLAFAGDVGAVMVGAEPAPLEVRYAEDEFFWVNTEHVFPHVASCLDTLPRDSRIAYLGFNGRMARWIDDYRARLNFTTPLVVSTLMNEIVPRIGFVRDEFGAAAESAAGDINADVIVVDFAIDQRLKAKFREAGLDPSFSGFRPPLPYASLCDATLALAARQRDGMPVKPGKARAPLFIFVSAFYFPIYRLVEGNFATPFNSLHCRMRQGYARGEPAAWFAAEWPAYHADIERFSESAAAARASTAPASQTTARAQDFAATNPRLKFRYGWSPLERNGVWSLGDQAMVSIEHDQPAGVPVMLEFEFSRVAAAVNGTIDVAVACGETDLATWTFPGRHRRRILLGQRISRSVTIPHALISADAIEIRLRLTNLSPPGPEDAYQQRGPRGIKLSRVKLRPLPAG